MASWPAPDSETPALANLTEVLAIPAYGTDPAEVCGLVVDRVQRLLAAERAAVFELDRELGSLVARASRGFPSDGPATWTVMPGDGLIGRAFQARRTLAATEPTDDDSFLARFPSSFAIATPLHVNGEATGVLFLGRLAGKPLNEEETALLRVLADRCETALAYQRLAARFERHADRLRRLAPIPAVVGREPLPAALARACAAACHALDVAAGVVTVGRGEAAVRASHGLDEAALADWAAEAGQRVPASHPIARSLGLRAVLAVPLRRGESALGEIHFLDRAERRFTRDEVGAAELAAALMAAAIENSRAFEETHSALQQLSAAQEQLIQAEKARALADVAGGIAHEFNNLLAIILGKTQLALERSDSSGVRDDLAVIEETAWRAADTVRRLLAFVVTRGNEGMGPVDLNALVQDVVTFTRGLWKDDAEARGVKVEVQTNLAETATVHGAAPELREALTNLVLNAVDAMPGGGRITISTRRREHAVELSVSDTGDGMAEEVRSRIFDPFFTTRSPQRAGLGLSVVKGIVGRHHGRIEVRTEEGRGTSFTVSLREARLPAGTAPAAPPPPARRGTGRVLVIEDEEHVRRMLLDTLAAAGHTVEGAANGLEGLARFQHGVYDVVVTDLSMPECSGLDVTRAVKRLRPGTPVVMITGWGDVVHPDRLQESGVDLMLVKPFKMDRVLGIVDDALARRGPR